MKCHNVWVKLGGRKFFVWFTNEVAIIGIGIFAGAKYGGEWGLAVIVAGLLINGLIYSAANIWVKASLPGGSSVSLGDGGKGDKDTLDNRGDDSDSHHSGPVDSVNDPVKPIGQGKSRGE